MLGMSPGETSKAAPMGTKATIRIATLRVKRGVHCRNGVYAREIAHQTAECERTEGKELAQWRESVDGVVGGKGGVLAAVKALLLVGHCGVVGHGR